MNNQVLIVDDDESFCLAMSKALRRKGFEVSSIQSGNEAIIQIPQLPAQAVVILDLKLPDVDGLSILKQTSHRKCQVLMLTGHGGVPEAVEAMRAGAYSFLTKPVDADEIEPLIKQMLTQDLSHDQNYEAVNSPIIGVSAYTQRLKLLIQRLAKIDECILITGEKGTGKELVAKAIHEYSPRKQQKWISINMACLPKYAIESELFGHVKGSTPWAHQDKDGLFKECAKGTLFLDEIAELPLDTQGSLLRALENHSFKAVGDAYEQAFEGRLVVATHKNLEAEVLAGRFREDLFEFLQVLPLHLPALRDRKADIIPILEYWFYKINQSKIVINAEVKNYLENYIWPGNIRELVNLAKRLSIFYPQGGEFALDQMVQLLEAHPFSLEHLSHPRFNHLENQSFLMNLVNLPPTLVTTDEEEGTKINVEVISSENTMKVGQEIKLEDLERAHIENLIGKYHNLTHVAKILGINRRTLQRKLKLWGSHMADIQDDTENS
jgi:DNA-binding NtrC family response regulator